MFEVHQAAWHNVDIPRPRDEAAAASRPLHKTIHHALLARLVERDGQLVAVQW
jgi:hypothetical protein